VILPRLSAALGALLPAARSRFAAGGPTQQATCIGEALRKFGLIENETTTGERFQTLIALLNHRSAVVRDGAMIGLAYLDDPRAIGAIEEAIRIEPLPVLRREMEAIREQLAHAAA
jgi:hypothetical protein